MITSRKILSAEKTPIGAWDISTATFSQSFTLQENSGGVFFKPDGTKMYNTTGNEDFID